MVQMAQSLAIKREDEEQALKRRLFYDGHGSGEDKKLMSIAKGIAKLCLVDHSDEEFNKLHSTIIKDIGIAIASVERHSKISDRCDRAIVNLETQIENEEVQIQQVQKELSNLELELEYVEKLKQVNVYPDCQTTQQSIRELEAKRDKLRIKVAKCADHMTTLMESCDNLRKILDE